MLIYMVSVFPFNRMSVHMSVVRAREIGGIDKREFDGCGITGGCVGPHAWLIVGHAIMSQHQSVAIQVIDGDHLIEFQIGFQQSVVVSSYWVRFLC